MLLVGLFSKNDLMHGLNGLLLSEMKSLINFRKLWTKLPTIVRTTRAISRYCGHRCFIVSKLVFPLNIIAIVFSIGSCASRNSLLPILVMFLKCYLLAFGRFIMLSVFQVYFSASFSSLTRCSAAACPKPNVSVHVCSFRLR